MEDAYDCCQHCEETDYCHGTSNNHIIECSQGCNDKSAFAIEWDAALLAYRDSLPVQPPPF